MALAAPFTCFFDIKLEVKVSHWAQKSLLIFAVSKKVMERWDLGKVVLNEWECFIWGEDIQSVRSHGFKSGSGRLRCASLSSHLPGECENTPAGVLRGVPPLGGAGRQARPVHSS